MDLEGGKFPSSLNSGISDRVAVENDPTMLASVEPERGRGWRTMPDSSMLYLESIPNIAGPRNDDKAFEAENFFREPSAMAMGILNLLETYGDIPPTEHEKLIAYLGSNPSSLLFK